MSGIAVTLVWGLLPYVACQSGNGSTYSLALLGLDIEENPEITYTLLMTNPGSDDVIVTIEDLSRGIVDTKTVAGGEVDSYDLAQPQAMNGTEIANKTVHVYSNSPFNLQVFSEKREYVEGFLAIPKESLYGPRGINNTYEYITTTFCAISGFCQIAISAFEDNTGVSVEFPKTTEEVVLCKGMGYYRSHRDKLIYLNKFDSIQFESASDLSGVRIYSFKPIAVFVGSRNVTQGDKEVHMIEQLNPSSQWGTKFALKALGENGYGDLVKISVHYENTTIDMKGFPLFKVTHYSHNVWRRLDKGMDTFIQASRPIQVVQITGLTYATEGEETAAAMTVVPAIQHGQTSFKLSCGKNEAGEFHIVSEALASDETKVGGEDVVTTNIAYTLYGIGNVSAAEAVMHEVGNNQAPVTGVVRCRGTALMPLGLQHQALPMKKTAAKPVLCKEMLRGFTSFDPVASSTTRRHQIKFGRFSIIQLRVRTCGHLTIQFLEDIDQIQNLTMFTITKTTVKVYECYPNCSTAPSTVDISSYTDGMDCKEDMMMYWFRQIHDTESDDRFLCFGTGPLADRGGTTCPSGSHPIPVPKRLVRALLVAAPGNAEFNYDLETIADCDYRLSNWRCEDKSPICEEYGQNICTEEPTYAKAHCAKYCKFCSPDSYGRKFLVVKPPRWMYSTCFIYVTGYRTTPNVAVGTRSRLIPVVKEHTEDRTKVYSCRIYLTSEPIVVVADADVAVSVVYRLNAASEAIMTYPVYPVDAYGNEFLMFSKMTDPFFCDFVSEYSSVDVVPYFTGTYDGLTDRTPFQCGFNYFKHTTSTNPSPPGLFLSEKPFTVVCGPTENPPSTHQMVSTDAWGTRYVVPAFEPIANIAFDISLRVIANRDNTVVYIDGDFNSVKAILNRGGTHDQIITGATTYVVSSTHPIGLAVVFTDITNPDIISFHVLPPSDGFLDAQVITIPTGLLKHLNQASSSPGFTASKFATDFVTPDETSSKAEGDSAGEKFITKYRTDGSFGISIVQSEDGRWMSLTGPRRFRNFTQSGYCQTSLPVAGDNVDNDCDTLIDEDTCFSGYGVYSDDFDLDGGFNEDCCCQDNNTAFIGKPTEPMCLEILNPAYKCWAICQVDCEWVAALNAYNGMTEEEKKAMNDAIALEHKLLLSVNKPILSATTNRKESAEDKRASAASIGYVGIAIYAGLFGTIFIMDIKSLIRDIMITGRNIREGFDRFRAFVKRGQSTTPALITRPEETKPAVQQK